MEIIYKGLSLEYKWHFNSGDALSFFFEHKGLNVTFRKSKFVNGYFTIDWSFITRDAMKQKDSNEVYLWLEKIENKIKEAQEFFHYLFKESPLRVKLLTEFGQEIYK